ncbi:MAG: hypothetical protein LBN00_12190 [Oscillospiraceae bacterium]|jgi:hypothetical protein|nr:hypothetical protein [Oscillospiraceae bacterium]
MENSKEPEAPKEITDPKALYLIKTLSRTKRKDYENFVVNRIYNLINNPNLQPVTQQYVLRPDGNYALLDLYFPQLGIAIECDEAFHKGNKPTDEERTAAILGQVKKTEQAILRMNSAISIREFAIQRVDASLPYDKFIARIDEVVEIIKNQVVEVEKKSGSLKWDVSPDYYKDKATQNGYISVNDNYEFRTHQAILDCFVPGKKATQSGADKLDKENIIWYPVLQTEETGSYAGWRNTISDDLNLIYDEIKDDENEKVEKEQLKLNHKKNEITFMKIRDSVFGNTAYKFVGIFQRTHIDKTKGERGATVLKRISDKVYLKSPWLSE